MRNEYDVGEKVWYCTCFGGDPSTREITISKVSIYPNCIEYDGVRDYFECPSPPIEGLKEYQLGRTEKRAKKNCLNALIFEKKRLVDNTLEEIEKMEHNLKEVENEN